MKNKKVVSPDGAVHLCRTVGDINLPGTLYIGVPSENQEHIIRGMAPGTYFCRIGSHGGETKGFWRAVQDPILSLMCVSGARSWLSGEWEPLLSMSCDHDAVVSLAIKPLGDLTEADCTPFSIPESSAYVTRRAFFATLSQSTSGSIDVWCRRTRRGGKIAALAILPGKKGEVDVNGD